MNNENLDTVLEQEVEASENKSKRKKLIVRIAAGVSAIVIAITGLVHLGKRKSSNDNTNSTATTTTTSSTTSFDLDAMGDELVTQTTTTHKVVSGDIDPDKIVEQDGKYYKDATEASKAKDKTTSINLKNDTLKTSVVKGNGTTTVKVYDKTTGYEIKGQGTTVTGNINESGIPEGYEYDSVLKKYLPKNEVGKYVYADATYYDNYGNVVLKKDDVVLKETLEKAKKYFSTTKPTTTLNTTTTKPTTTLNTTTTTTTVKNNSTTVTTTTTTSNEGVVNKDGTYTIYGLTFKTKADYQQWVLQDYEGYVEADGIMISIEELNNRLQKTK